MTIEQISPEELKRRMASDAPPRVIDVREPWEVEIAAIPGATYIPLGQLPQRLAELDPKADTVLMCKAGGRSQRAAAFLQSKGFEHLANLSGGIDAWTRDIDPSLKSY